MSKIVWHLRGWVVVVRRASCLGVFCWLALPRARFGVLLFGHTLSERRGVLFPRPMGLLTVRVLVNGGSAPPRVSTSSLVLRQSSPGTAHPLAHRLISAEPRTLTATRPLGHSRVFPHPDARRVYLVDSFIAHIPQNNTQTTSLTLTPYGHTFSG